MNRCVAVAAIDETATIVPPPFATRCGTASFMVRNAPVRLVPMIPFHSSSVVR